MGKKCSMMIARRTSMKKSLNGDGNEKEDNEEMPLGDSKEDKDEPGALLQ
jgi:hypothetical protein